MRRTLRVVYLLESTGPSGRIKVVRASGEALTGKSQERLPRIFETATRGICADAAATRPHGLLEGLVMIVNDRGTERLCRVLRVPSKVTP